jgi:hypothetical protein
MKLKYRSLLLLTSCLVFGSTIGLASDDLRLSRTLIPSEYTDSGLSRLTSDQVAILDALVRRDMATGSRVAHPTESRFSERLSADEQRNAGLTLLTPEERSKLDSYVARLTAPLTPTSGGFTSGSTTGTRVSATSLRRAPEIHGSISLMYGQGSDGYSERGGAMVLSYEDPSGFALAVGYSEIRTKGGNYWRDYYYDRPFGGFDRRFSGLDLDPFPRRALDVSDDRRVTSDRLRR